MPFRDEFRVYTFSVWSGLGGDNPAFVNESVEFGEEGIMIWAGISEMVGLTCTLSEMEQ